MEQFIKGRLSVILTVFTKEILPWLMSPLRGGEK